LTAVHQALAGVGPYDAVSEQAVAWRRLLGEWGHTGGDHAAIIDPRVAGSFRPLSDLEPAPGDLVIVRYSAWSPRLAPLLDHPGPLLVVYHNITPADYLWRHNAGVAAQCAIGRARLPRFARAATVATADSEFNAAELRAAGADDVRVVPILFDPARLAAGGGGAPPGDGPLVLVVGRVVPNKRPDLVLRAFAAYRDACAPDARLLVVGDPLSPPFGALVRDLAAAAGVNGASLAGATAQPDLNAAYAAADVLLTLSEHEGFCIPLLEAFHFGVPVVARPAGAMPEVAGDAALWTDPDADAAVTAELIDAAVRDSELRAELGRRGRARLEAYSFERTAGAIRAAVEAALGA
jgi:glycosyltransferase involved in cell wall biosynthesis